jgi:uncharacterized membrane protein
MAITEQIEQKLQTWVGANLIDAEVAGRIRSFESSHESRTRWPIVVAIAFGSIMVAAGVLLFVSAHWDDLSPTQRFLIVVAMVAGFHLAAGMLMPRIRALGLALHAIGTVALGGGIFLAGQIFNLQEHWPGGILLWAIGAVLSWWVLRDWLQATLVAMLIPAWMASEWSVRAEHLIGMDRFLIQFLTLLAITYLSVRHADGDSSFRRALAWVGGLALLPLCGMLAVVGHDWDWFGARPMPVRPLIAAYVVTFALPLALAWFVRGKAVIWNAGFALWILILSRLDSREVLQNVAIYAWCALGAIALVLWGLREQRRERINLGIAGFAITIVAFYFSTMMDKLGRSASLVGFGLLFLFGGWKLEQLRRKLVARAVEVSR